MNNYDKLFLEIAEKFSEYSHCVSIKVGAVAVIENRIIATGINGTLQGVENCNDIFINYNKNTDREKHHSWSNLNEIHAEMNILIYCAKYGISLNGSTLYITHHPCNQCLKNLLQTGIKRIVYKNNYDKFVDNKIINKFIKKNNIIIEKYKGI